MDNPYRAEWNDKYPYELNSMSTKLIRAEIRELQNVIGEWNISNDGYADGMYYARLLDLIGELELRTEKRWIEAMMED